MSDEWLQKCPSYTTFRINSLKRNKYNESDLKEILKYQSKLLETSSLPKYYFLSPNCLVLEVWPDTIKIECECKEVIVDVFCAAAVLRGSHVFAPGVLGLPPSCNVGDIVDIYGDLDGQCKRGLKVKYEGNKIFVGKGILKMVRRDLFDDGIQPSGTAVETILPESKLPVINESVFEPGVAVLQNLPSIVCGWVVNAQKNELILDMCASPGNKTTHLAESSGDQATIIAIDKTIQKIERVKENCIRQGVTCVSCHAFDSTKCYSENSINNNAPPFSEGTFDKILLDGPCSGLGQRPQLVNKMTPSMMKSYVVVQRKLLTAAVKILKVGGRLVYSTCTVTKEENECMVAWVLHKFANVTLVAAEPLLGGPGLAGCGLSDEQRVLVQRFGPESDPLRIPEPIYRDTIGFFIASFTKTA